MPKIRASPCHSGTSPISTLISVVLPAPFGPSRPKMLPRPTSSVTPSSARKPLRPPKLFTSPRKEISGSAAGMGGRLTAHEPRSPDPSGARAEAGGQETHGVRAVAVGPLPQGAPDPGLEHVQRGREAAAKDEGAYVQERQYLGQAAPEVVADLLQQHALGARPLARQLGQEDEIPRLLLREPAFRRAPASGSGRGEHLEATARAAAARRTVRIDVEVAGFTGQALADEQLAGEDQPAANAGAEREQEQVVEAARRSQPLFSQGGHVRVVLEADRRAVDPERFSEDLGHGHVDEPRQVGALVH